MLGYLQFGKKYSNIIFTRIIRLFLKVVLYWKTIVYSDSVYYLLMYSINKFVYHSENVMVIILRIDQQYFNSQATKKPNSLT